MSTGTGEPQPPQAWLPGFWTWTPIIRDPDVNAQLETIKQQLEEIMALVKVEQSDLDALDAALDEATTALSAKLGALDLPPADLAALNEDLDALRALAAPAPVVEPPATAPFSPPAEV